LPAGTSFLLFQGGQDGPVVVEVDAHHAARSVHVKPGTYYVRGRGEDYLLEGRVDAAPGAALEVDTDELSRVDYAVMVRRGGQAPDVHGSAFGYQARTSILRGASACHGPFAAYVREGPELRFMLRLSACRGEITEPEVSADTDELSLAARFARAWDTPFASFDAGGGLGLALLHESFEPEGVAHPRNTLSPHLEAGGSVIRYLPSGFYLALELDALAYALPTESSLHDKEVVMRFAARLGLQLGIEFADF